MEREDQGPRQSSLPSSLIPHLYSRPQHRVSNSSTLDRPGQIIPPMMREGGVVSSHELPQGNPSSILMTSAPQTAVTGLPFIGAHGTPRFYSPYLPMESETPNPGSFTTMSDDPRMPGVRRTPNMSTGGQRYGSPIYSDPVYHASRTPPAIRPGLGYSMAQALPRDQISRPTWPQWREGDPGQSSVTLSGSSSRTSVAPHQFQRFSQQSDVFNSPTWSEGQVDGFQGGGLVQTETSLQTGMVASAQRLYQPQSSQPIQELPPPRALFPGSEAPSSVIYGRTHEAYPSSQDFTSSAGSQRSWPSEPAASPLPPIKVDSASRKTRKIKREDLDEFKPAQLSKKLRDDSVVVEKKTQVACDFCRARKLRCSGARPSCHNCTVRQKQCVYAEKVNRRGPGKANKSKSKEAERVRPGSGSRRTGSPSSFEDPESPAETRAPRQPYTLENFTFKPPTTPPEYSDTPVVAEMEAQQVRGREEGRYSKMEEMGGGIPPGSPH